MAISKPLSKWKEADLFKWLSVSYYKLLVDTSGGYSKSDCYDIATKHRIELKCRAKHYDDLIIEKNKYKHLVDVSKKSGDIPIYINSTPKGIYLFKLNDIKFKWFKKSLPKTTDFKNKKTVKKEISKININQSIKLK